MSYLALFFMITSVVVIALIAWSYTKPGKKWHPERYARQLLLWQ